MKTDAKKFISHKNCTMQNKKITHLETDEIKKELQESQTRNLSKSKKEQLEQLCMLSNDEQKQNSAPTTPDRENKQQRNVNKFKEKIASTYYQMAQTETGKRPRPQKL
jgi:hypothetical protein